MRQEGDQDVDGGKNTKKFKEPSILSIIPIDTEILKNHDKCNTEESDNALGTETSGPGSNSGIRRWLLWLYVYWLRVPACDMEIKDAVLR